MARIHLPLRPTHLEEGVLICCKCVERSRQGVNKGEMREPYITMVAESRVDSDARAGAHADKMNFVLLQFYSTLIIN